MVKHFLMCVRLWVGSPALKIIIMNKIPQCNSFTNYSELVGLENRPHKLLPVSILIIP